MAVSCTAEGHCSFCRCAFLAFIIHVLLDDSVKAKHIVACSICHTRQVCKKVTCTACCSPLLMFRSICSLSVYKGNHFQFHWRLTLLMSATVGISAFPPPLLLGARMKLTAKNVFDPQARTCCVFETLSIASCTGAMLSRVHTCADLPPEIDALLSCLLTCIIFTANPIGQVDPQRILTGRLAQSHCYEDSSTHFRFILSSCPVTD